MRRCLPIVAVWLLQFDVAEASVTALTDFGRTQLQTVSFFLFGVLVCALATQMAWNFLQADFPSWPRLNYRTALAVTCTWGLLCGLVMTMIPGGRMLLEPTGVIESQLAAEAAVRQTRQERLDLLRTALLAHAAKHAGKYPGSLSEMQMPGDAWSGPPPRFVEYVYFKGRTATDAPRVLACEAAEVDGVRYALFTNGAINPLPPVRPIVPPKHESTSGIQ